MVRKRKLSKLARQDSRSAYAMISPVVFGFFAMLLFPLLYEMYLSFTDATIMGDATFVGLENYKTLFTDDPRFLKAIGNSLYFTFALVPLNITFALFLANMLNKKLKGIGIFRTIIFMPSITPIIVWAIVWKLLLATDIGIINSYLKMIGITGPAWLYDMKLTMPVLIFNTLLKGVGLNMVIFLAAMKDIPEVYYEAARIDGAKSWQTFFHITLPMLSPTVFMVMIMTIIGSLKVFSNVYLLTGGGPADSTLLIVYYIYVKAFREYEFGYAAAVAMILFFILLILTVIQWQMRRRLVYAED